MVMYLSNIYNVLVFIKSKYKSLLGSVCVCVCFNVSVRDQFMLQRLVVGCTGSTLIVRSDGTTANMFSHPGYVTSLRKHILNTLSTDTERLKLFHSIKHCPEPGSSSCHVLLNAGGDGLKDFPLTSH